MSAAVGREEEEEEEVDANLAPTASGTCCNGDIEVLERSIQFALETLRMRKEAKCGNCVLAGSLKSLMHTYTVAIRATVPEAAAAHGDSENHVWKPLLKLTTDTGRVIADICSLQDTEAATVNLVTQAFSVLLRPPLERERMEAGRKLLFWQLYPWWCYLLQHSLASPLCAAEPIASAAQSMAFRAFGWVSHHYAASSAVGGLTSGTVDVFAFLAALHPSSHAKERGSVERKLPECDMQLSFGCEELADTMYPMSLGQSLDVGGADIVRSSIRAERGWLGVRNVDDEEDAPNLGMPPSVAVAAPCEADQLNHLTRDLPASQRALFVAAKLGTLFAAQDLHTLIPFFSRGGASERGGAMNIASHARKGELEWKMKGKEFCCDVCSLMERRVSQQSLTGVCASAALSLLILHMKLLRAPLYSSVSVRRCVGEKVAAAAVVALLRRDADVADALLSVLTRTCVGTASRCFVAFWRAAFSPSSGSFSDSMAWLLAGLARSITLHAAVRDGNKGENDDDDGNDGRLAFMEALDGALESVIDTMTALLPPYPVKTTGLPSHRARDLSVRGFMEIWIALLHATPQRVGAALENRLCEFMIGCDSERGSARARRALHLREFFEEYFASVMEQRLIVLQQQGGEGKEVTVKQHQLSWWPNMALGAHEHCSRVLQHTLALSECICRVDLASHLSDGTVSRGRRHPAAFFLEGNEGLCVRLLSIQPDVSLDGQIEELCSVAAQIISAAGRTLSTKLGRAIFVSPFGGSSGRYAATYTRLLYLCFLEEAKKFGCSEYPYMRALLQALRSLVIGERGAHRTAVKLSIPVVLSSMLPKGTVVVDAGGAMTKETTPPATPCGESVPIVDSLVCTLTDELGSSCSDVPSHDTGSGISGVVCEDTRSSARVPLIPALSFGALAPPQYFFPSGEKDDVATEEHDCSSAVVVLPKLMLPPLNPVQQNLKVTTTLVSVNSVSQKTSHFTLDDPPTLAELLLLVCCLLPGREGGMIGQSSLVVAHNFARWRSKRPQNDTTGAKPPFVRVLRMLEEFVRHPANGDSVQLFDTLVTKELQTANCIWAGVDVLRRLLLQKTNLLDGLILTRRIAAGGYGAVFSFTPSSGANTPCRQEWCMDDAQPIAAKMVPIARRDVDDYITLVSCHTEATALLRLQGHRHICKLLFFGCCESQYVIAMSLYKGGSLRQWRVAKSGFPLGACVGNIRFRPSKLSCVASSTDSCPGALLSVCGPIFSQVLEAIEFMHANHIRHNDIKADNILIEDFHVEVVQFIREADGNKRQNDEEEEEEERDGEKGKMLIVEEKEVVIPTSIRLCDFGVCEVVGEDIGSLPHAGAGCGDAYWGPTKGTEAVQAPEVLSMSKTSSVSVAAVPDEVDVVRDLAADMWACGCLLYELLTGVMLFEGANVGRLLTFATTSGGGGNAQREVLQPHQRRILDTAGRGITDFVLQLLALDPAERPSALAARQAWDNIIQMQERRSSNE